MNTPQNERGGLPHCRYHIFFELWHRDAPIYKRTILRLEAKHFGKEVGSDIRKYAICRLSKVPVERGAANAPTPMSCEAQFSSCIQNVKSLSFWRVAMKPFADVS